MLRFAMNSPGNEDRGIGSGSGGVRRVNRLLVPACFTVLALLHIVFLSVFDFFAKSERPFTETRELFLTLDFADNGPEESAELAQSEVHVAAQTAARELPLPAAPLPEEGVPPLSRSPKIFRFLRGNPALSPRRRVKHRLPPQCLFRRLRKGFRYIPPPP